jgi:hypothetical protein
MKMEQTGCSETSAHKIQTPQNHPKERIQKSVKVCDNEVILNWDTYILDVIYFTILKGAAAWYHAAALLTANPPLQQNTIPHAVICSLTLLMTGKCLSETC